MEYQKPIVNISGDLFRVEYSLDCLQLVSDRAKTIAFSGMEDSAKDYWRRFLYDSRNKELYTIPEGLKRLDPHILYVELPSKRVLDAVADMRENGSKEAHIPQVFFERNIAGWEARIMPRVKFLSDEFFVDVRQLAFVDTINIGNKISMDDVNVMPNDRISVDYDLSTRSIPDPESEEYYKDATCIIFLEPLKDIDPAGFALLQSLPSLNVLPAKRTTSRIPKSRRPPPSPGQGPPKGKTMF